MSETIDGTENPTLKGAEQAEQKTRFSKRDVSPSKFQKECALCKNRGDVRIRCQFDGSGTWHFVCPGKCWSNVSGGVIDGDESHPLYVYGGTWKNKHAMVTGKKPKKRAKAKKESLSLHGKDDVICREPADAQVASA